MSYSSTRKETFRWVKSATCTSASPLMTSSPSATLRLLTRPPNSALTVSPFPSLSRLSPSVTS